MLRRDRRIRVLLAGRPDTAEEIAWRYADNEARRLARLEMDARYPEITQANFRDACREQEETINAIREELLK